MNINRLVYPSLHLGSFGLPCKEVYTPRRRADLLLNCDRCNAGITLGICSVCCHKSNEIYLVSHGTTALGRMIKGKTAYSRATIINNSRMWAPVTMTSIREECGLSRDEVKDLQYQNPKSQRIKRAVSQIVSVPVAIGAIIPVSIVHSYIERLVSSPAVLKQEMAEYFNEEANT